MSSNPTRGNNRKEKRMHAITKTTSVAVLVALGLTLAVSAAEPAKAATPADLNKLADPVPFTGEGQSEGDFCPGPVLECKA